MMIKRTREEVIKIWVEALRSGEFKQGANYLKQQAKGSETPTFCCLGVLAELAHRDGGPAFETGTTKWRWVNSFRYGGKNGSRSFLPLHWGKWLFPNNSNAVSNLMTANDGEVPFTEICKMIEEMAND
jgi:hypothetical protein